MAQHDWNIANQTFPPTRADLNNALLAAATNSSGTAAPGTPLACQWWADTTNDVMKFRNTANDEWIELFQLTDGVIVQPVTVEAVPVGTVVAWPGLTAPTKWHLLDGSVLVRTEYPGLFNVLGTRYNTGGETSAQFRLPDMRGRTVVGRDNMGGTAAGRVTSGVSGIGGQTVGATGGNQRMQEHTHPGATPTISYTAPTVSTDFTGDMLTATTGTLDQYFALGTPGPGSDATYYRGFNVSLVGGSVAVTNPGTTGSQGAGASQNMPPCMIYNWIIFTGGEGAEGDGGSGNVDPTLGPLEARQIALGDETTAADTPGELVRLRWPYDFVVTAVRLTANTACATGTLEVTATVDGGALFATALTIDATEKTSKTAAVPAVLAIEDIADDDEIVITLADEGDGTATGLKITFYGYRVIN
jgi:microcystin-dependent protein